MSSSQVLISSWLGNWHSPQTFPPPSLQSAPNTRPVLTCPGTSRTTAYRINAGSANRSKVPNKPFSSSELQAILKIRTASHSRSELQPFLKFPFTTKPSKTTTANSPPTAPMATQGQEQHGGPEPPPLPSLPPAPQLSDDPESWKPAQQNQSPFFCFFPPEIRVMILREAFDDRTIHIDWRPPPPTYPNPFLLPQQRDSPPPQDSNPFLFP